MKYRAELTDKEQTTEEQPNKAEIFVEQMLLEFELLREIWEHEGKYKRKRRH